MGRRVAMRISTHVVEARASSCPSRKIRVSRVDVAPFILATHVVAVRRSPCQRFGQVVDDVSAYDPQDAKALVRDQIQSDGR